MHIFLPLVFLLLQPASANATMIDGIVVKPDGSVAVGAVVALINYPQTPKITVTGAKGHFQIDDVQDGEYGISAMLAGVGAENQMSIKVRQSENVQKLELHLVAGVETISGRVNKKSAENTINLQILAQLQTESSYPIYGSIVNNEFQITLPPGRYTLTANSIDFESSNLFLTIPRLHSGPIDIPLFLSSGSNPALAREIHEMANEDQKARDGLIVDGVVDQQRLSAMIAIDKSNHSRLQQLISAGKWIGAEELGARGEGDLWLLVQHDSALLKDCLPLMMRAADNFELPWARLALSVDRVLVDNNKPQIYGSQVGFDKVTHQAKSDLIEDEAHVDQRRAELGMEPMAEYLNHFK